MIKVAINGFGRIGRIAFRQMITDASFDIVAINNLDMSAEEAAYLIKYDSVHGAFHENEISYKDDSIVISNVKFIKMFNEKDPALLPWKDLGVDLVLECTGAFTSTEKASLHLNAGAKKVLISAPGKDEMITVVNGVNDDNLTGSETIVSASSCTTNCLAPLLKIIEDNFGIEKGFMSTVHAYTADQNSMDNMHKKGINSRRGRASAHNIVPTSTGAAKSIGLVIPSLKGKLDGIAYRVPTIDGSMIDVTLELKVPVTKELINETIKKSKKDGMVNSMIHITNLLKNVNIDIKRKVFKEILDNLGGNLRIIVSAAAPIDAKVGKWVEDIGIKFLQGYGLTETAPIAALTPEYEPSRYASTGMAVKDTDIKLKNVNDAGEGEILIKGPTVMLGYYEDEKATNEVMEDGYFCSGDIGRIDSDGFIYITGRSKNVIVTQNGKNIYPEEIELMLGKIPEISECMVYGKKESEDAHDKELIITAKIIPNYTKIEELHGKNLSDDDIYKIIWDKVKENNKKLTSYKAVKKIEIKKDEFEKTTTMKIKRFAEINKDKAIK